MPGEAPGLAASPRPAAARQLPCTALLARATRPSLRSAWPSPSPPHRPHLASCPRSRFARARELVGPAGCASPGPRDASCNVADFIYNKDLENSAGSLFLWGMGGWEQLCGVV